MAFNTKKPDNFIGVGLTLPLQLAKGRAVLETGIPLVRSSIRLILQWPKFTRWYLETFGCELTDQIEEPNDHILARAVERFVTDSIEQWEKRVELSGPVRVEQTQSTLYVKIPYRLINSQQEDNFVFPFYESIK